MYIFSEAGEKQELKSLSLRSNLLSQDEHVSAVILN